MQPDRSLVVVVAGARPRPPCIERLLAADGPVVVLADSVADGLAVVERDGASLVLVDLAALGPVLALRRRLRVRDRAAYLPVLLLATSDEPAERRAGLDAGADDCVPTLFDGRQLLDWVRIWLRAAGSLEAFRQRLAAEGDRSHAQPRRKGTAREDRTGETASARATVAIAR